MHKRKDWTFANGEQWVLQTDGGFLEDLEELNDGAPALAVLGDIEDIRYRRIARMMFALTTGFRARVSEFSGMTYAQFRDGGYLPEYESPAWDHMVLEMSELCASAFPHAIKKGRALLMVTREALKLGLLELSTESLESGDDESLAPLVIRTPSESIGSCNVSTPT